MTKRLWIVVILLFAFGFFLRFWQLGNIPEGFYSDEALYGYEAYSLIKTGNDQFGNHLPLSFAGFGDFRPGAYIYFTVPFIFKFGLTEFATRFPSALTGSLTLIVTFFLIRTLTKSNKSATLGTLVLSLSPWALFFGRMAHETNLMTLLITLGLLAISYLKKNKLFLFIGILCFSLSLYTYHSARVFLPLYLFVLLYIYRDWVKRNWKVVLVASLFLILLCVPLTLELKNGGLSRIKGISIWNDPGIISRINATRGDFINRGWSGVLAKIAVNKVTIYSLVFAENYLTHFSADLLLFKGDPNGVYNTPHTGILLWTEPILILIGSWYLLKTNRKLGWVVLLGIFVALVPDSLTKVAPSSARIHLALPFVALLNGVGWNEVLKRSRFGYWVLGIALVISSLWFWKNYLEVRPVVHARAWQMGVKEMVIKAEKYADDYEKIWISRSGWGWIHILFHTKYDPATFQKEATHSEPNELGFWWVGDFGKYHLEWLPQDLWTDTMTLYIAEPEEFPVDTSFMYELIRYDNKKYWFVDSGHL